MMKIVFIHAKDNGLEGTFLERAVQEAVDVKTLKIGIKRTKFIDQNKCFLVNCLNKDSADKLSEKLNSSGSFSANRPRKRNPRIFVPAVPVVWTAEELITNIIDQSHVSADVLNPRTFMPKFRFKPRECEIKSPYIVEVTPELREYLRSHGDTLCFGWQSVKLRDFFSIRRCTNCWAFNHTRRNCTKTSPICPDCSVEGHTPGKCANIEDEKFVYKCVNCVKYNSTCKNFTNRVNPNHSAKDRGCPVYQHQVRIEESRLKKPNNGN